MSEPRQSTAVAIGGRAVLIEGPPGIGKSGLALALIDRGAMLIGDDSIMLDVAGDRLFASPHPRTRGLLEVRNLGLLPFPVCARAPAALVLRLDRDAPRFAEAAGEIGIAGMVLPALALFPESPVLAIKAELALARFGLG